MPDNLDIGPRGRVVIREVEWRGLRNVVVGEDAELIIIPDPVPAAVVREIAKALTAPRTSKPSEA